jgi:hypothetical protein
MGVLPQGLYLCYLVFECRGRAFGLWDKCDYFEESRHWHGCKWRICGGYKISADECESKAAQEAARTEAFRPKAEGDKGRVINNQ